MKYPPHIARPILIGAGFTPEQADALIEVFGSPEELAGTQWERTPAKARLPESSRSEQPPA